jgi:hypothetical protein
MLNVADWRRGQLRREPFGELGLACGPNNSSRRDYAVEAFLASLVTFPSAARDLLQQFVVAEIADHGKGEWETELSWGGPGGASERAAAATPGTPRGHPVTAARSRDRFDSSTSLSGQLTPPPRFITEANRAKSCAQTYQLIHSDQVTNLRVISAGRPRWATLHAPARGMPQSVRRISALSVRPSWAGCAHHTKRRFHPRRSFSSANSPVLPAAIFAAQMACSSSVMAQRRRRFFHGVHAIYWFKTITPFRRLRVQREAVAPAYTLHRPVPVR